MTSGDRDLRTAKAINTRPSIDQLRQALPIVSQWDTAGATIFEAVRYIRQLTNTETQIELLALAESCCIRLLESVGTDGIAPEILYLPPLKQEIVGFTTNKRSWSTQLDEVLLKQKNTTFQWSNDHLVALISIEGMIHTSSKALSQFLDALASVSQLHTSNGIDLERIGGQLFHTAWFEIDSEEILDGISRLARMAEQNDKQTAFVIINHTLKAFHLIGAPIWLAKALADILVFPFFQRSPKTLNEANLILGLETMMYTQYLKKVDTRAHFESMYKAIAPALEESGNILKKKLSPVPHPRRTKPAKIAFLLHSPAYLAHARNYVTFLEGISKLDKPLIEPITYINGNYADNSTEPLPKAILERGSTIRWIDYRKGGILDYLTTIRDQSVRDGVLALVFISTPTYLITSAKARLAPKIIWWAMKYHALSCEDIDGYVTYGSFGEERIIDGRTWRSTLPALDNLFDPNASEKVPTIRREYTEKGYDCLIACMGREEKINHRPYLKSIQNFLKHNPRASFLWTGRSIPPEVSNIMKELGITERCKFLGWVDTRLYAQVIDIYTDSYPFASGYTAYEAMAAGKPVVVLETPEALETSSATMILPILNRQAGTRKEQDRAIEIFSDDVGDLAFSPFAPNVEVYESKVSKLMDDQLFRKRSGQAGQLFFNEFLGNKEQMTKNICTHFIDIIDSKE
ncbi:MAG: glycosyltransferase [Rhodospirillaceae bacterium]